MKLVRTALSFALTASLASINPAFAYTDAEIDEMFEALKEENSALKQELEELKTEPSVITEQAVNPSSATQNNSQLNYVKNSLEKQESRFKVNGFLTAGLVKANPAVANQVYSFSDNASFNPDSILGLQSTFKLSDKTEVTAQLVARGNDNWDLEAEWAFLRYDYTDSISFRAGRLRIPIYLYSESLEVGYSYPWIRPPAEVYQASINNYEGMDATYTFGKGDRVHQIQFFVGNNQGDNFETDILGGINITSYYGSWTARASVFTYDITIDIPTGPANTTAFEDGAIFYTFGTTFDDGDWLFITELSKFDVDDFTIFSDTAAGYVTVGKYVGKFLPHITYAKSYSTKEPVPHGGPNDFTGESYTLGLRYNLSYATSLKFEWAHYRDMDGTIGIWNRTPPADLMGVDDINIYSISLDAVF
jgi:hypothetical protein